MKKKLPIGIEDFKEIIEKDCYYVDKTYLLRNFWITAARYGCLPGPGALEKHWLSACFGIILKKKLQWKERPGITAGCFGDLRFWMPENPISAIWGNIR